jgi:hypothetical protein
MVIVMGGRIAAINASSTVCTTRHVELLMPASSRSSGERIQDILAEIVSEQCDKQMGV